MKKIKIIQNLKISNFFLNSCMKITKSTSRLNKPKSIEFGNCKISSTGSVCINIVGFKRFDFMPASIKIEIDGTKIYIDPLLVDDSLKADYIFITHNHPDHFSKIDIDKLLKPETIIIGPTAITKYYKNHNIRTVSIGDKKQIGIIKYEVVESYNTNSILHKKGNNNVAYIIILDKTRIYIAGDTDYIPEMKELKDITVAIIPIGESFTAMNTKDAAKAINQINPQLVIPIHYALNKNREKDFLQIIVKQIQVFFFNKII